jgi:hypothetical protein
MAKKKDDGFTGRALMALVTAMVDHNYRDAEVIVAALAKEHGYEAYAARVFNSGKTPTGARLICL